MGVVLCYTTVPARMTYLLDFFSIMPSLPVKQGRQSIRVGNVVPESHFQCQHVASFGQDKSGFEKLPRKATAAVGEEVGRPKLAADMLQPNMIVVDHILSLRDEICLSFSGHKRFQVKRSIAIAVILARQLVEVYTWKSDIGKIWIQHIVCS